MKKLFFLFLPLFLYGQQAMPPEKATSNRALGKMPTAEKVSPAALTSTDHSVMVIDAKARANDILSAYDFLKREKPTYHISAHTYSGQTLSNIVDLTAMPNGTWLIIHLATLQGTKTQIISVDEISELFYP